MNRRPRPITNYASAALCVLLLLLAGCAPAESDETAAPVQTGAADEATEDPTQLAVSSQSLMTLEDIANGKVDPNFCWKDSYGRGVGTIPDSCGGQQKDGALCYPYCAGGYYGVGPVCWQACPAGWRDDGTACWLDSSIISGNNSQCPWYDVCGLTFAPGCSTCPSGYVNDGCTCRRDVQMFYKNTYGRGAGQPMACNGSLQYDAGLCYNYCNAGYGGVGPVCWGQCPAAAPVQCAAGCAVSQTECTNRIISQITTTLDMAGNIAAMVASLGTSSAAKYVTSVGLSAAAKATLKQQIKDELRKQFRDLAEYELEAMANAAVSGAQGQAIDYASLDPTGIAKMVEAFYAPQCSAMFQSNRARGKPTYQSSTDAGGASARAVDGNTDGQWSAGSTTHTATQPYPWWQVDLQQATKVNQVVIWNRTDCCSDRLSNFKVELRNAANQPVGTQVFSGVAGPKTVFDFGGAPAHSVVVQLFGTAPLSLAEVEVLGVGL